MPSGLDGKDDAIIAELKRNARSSIRDISKATGIRPSTVHGRIKRMEEDGVIKGYTVRLDDAKVGRGFAVYLFAAGSLDRYLDQRTLGHEAITMASGLTGEHDLLLKLKFRDIAEFNAFLIDFRQRFKSAVHRTVTMVETARLKEEL